MNTNKSLIKNILIALVLAIPFTNYAQIWPQIYGDNLRAYGKDIIESYDKGYTICGSILKDASHFKYGWLIKTDINGNELWNKKFGDGSVENSFYDFDKTNDNGFILSGSTAQYDIEIDPLFVKLNSCGEIEWCNIFLSPGFNTGSGVIGLPNGEFLGMLQYYGGDYAHKRISLVKMDSSGDPIWIKHLAQEDSTIVNEEGYNLYLTLDNNYLVTGRCFCPSKKPFFIKTDTSGEQLWDIRWPVGYGGWAGQSVFASNGMIYNGSNLQFIGKPRIPYLLKFHNDGDIINQYALLADTIENGGAESLLLVDDTIMYVGITWTDDPTYEELYSDILKIDTLGNLIMQRRLVDDGYAPSSIIQSGDNKILTLGTYYVDGNWDIYLWKMNTDLEDDTLYTQPLTYDSLCPYEIQSDTVELDCGLYVNIDEIPTKEEYESTIKISPNPARDWVVLTLPDVVANGKVEVVVYDIFGREAWGRGGMEKLPVNRMVLMNVSGYPAGMYIAVVVDQKGRRYTGKFVVN